MVNTLYFADEEQLQGWGKQLANAILHTPRSQGFVIYLNGDLGTGKTYLSRAIIQSLGFTQNVKSPTYTLVEEYHLTNIVVYHFDLYRLADPEELAFMGIRDYFQPHSLCLVEWSSQGEGFLPPADVVIELSYAPKGRNVQIIANTPTGKAMLHHLGEG